MHCKIIILFQSKSNFSVENYFNSSSFYIQTKVLFGCLLNFGKGKLIINFFREIFDFEIQKAVIMPEAYSK